MATQRKYNGHHKHHSRRHQSSDQMNRRRLSKQEEIDLPLETIDLKEEVIDSNEKLNNLNAIINNETAVPPTIHVEDKCDHKLMVEKEKNEKREVFNDLNENSTQSMHKNDLEFGQSVQSLGVDLNFKQSNSLSTDDNREKKRGKHLARAEAVRDTSASPPPTQLSDSDENSSHMLAPVVSSNSQSQMGSSMSSQSHKNKIKAQGSSSGSLDRSSPCLSRDSSTENYSDLTGTDVQQFLMETLQKNKKDRVFLLKIEQDLNGLVKDCQKSSHKFLPMTSYNRMLVHRVAALFGFEHNVDSLGTSVVVNKSKSTRIPDLKFKDYIKEDSLHEPKKLILKRDSASLEDGSNGSQLSFDGKEKSPDRQTGNLSDSSRSKSFEEREERYEKARARIFNQDSSSSTEGNDTSSVGMADNNSTTNGSTNQLMQRNSSPRSSQSTEDLPTKSNNWTNNEVRAWSSSDSDSSGRLQKNDSKPSQQTIQTKADNSDSDITPKPNTLSSGETKTLLAPDVSTTEASDSRIPSKTRPTVTKASSFGGISHNVDNNYKNSTQTQSHLSKSGSFNVTNNGTQPQNAVNAINTNRAITPKNNYKQESAHKSYVNNSNSGPMGPTHHSEQRYHSSQPPSQRISSPSASHHIRHNNWHQNSNSRCNNRMGSMPPSAVQWPTIVNQNYPHFILQSNDLNINQMKETQYLQSGQQLFVSSIPNYGQPVNSEPQQHLAAQPIRLIYPNQSQPQLQTNLSNLSSYGNLLNNSVGHQSVSNQMNSVQYPVQSSQSPINYSTNHSNLQNNPLIPTSFQVPSNIGTVWIINNGVGVHPQSSSPMMACPPPPNTPPSASIGSNIAPFVGMSYQHYRPTMNSGPNMNPNLSLNAASNRAPNPLLKTQPLLATHSHNNSQRIMPSNGNHYLQQQVPDMVEMNNIMGANNYINRAPVVSQMSQLRRMPINTNQGLDVRLVGSHPSPPFLLPTPQRPYFPVPPNSVSVNHRHSYANPNSANNTNNLNQRSKNTFFKHKPQRYNTNNRNIIVANQSNHCPNT